MFVVELSLKTPRCGEYCPMSLFIFRHFNFFPHNQFHITSLCSLKSVAAFRPDVVDLIFSQFTFYYQLLPLYYIAKEHLRLTSPQDPFSLFSQNIPRLLPPFLFFSGFHKDLNSPECPASTVQVSDWLALEGLSTLLHLSVTLNSPPFSHYNPFQVGLYCSKPTSQSPYISHVKLPASSAPISINCQLSNSISEHNASSFQFSHTSSNF